MIKPYIALALVLAIALSYIPSLAITVDAFKDGYEYIYSSYESVFPDRQFTLNHDFDISEDGLFTFAGSCMSFEKDEITHGCITIAQIGENISVEDACMALSFIASVENIISPTQTTKKTARRIRNEANEIFNKILDVLSDKLYMIMLGIDTPCYLGREYQYTLSFDDVESSTGTMRSYISLEIDLLPTE